MKQTSFLSSLRPHLPFVLGLFVIASLYFLPAWQGKVINMSDAQQSLAASQEVRQIAKETGRMPIWTDALFGGMPTYLVAYDFPNTFVGKAGYKLLSILPNPVNMVFMEMLAAYILLIVMGVGSWLALIGAVAYGFGAYNIQIIEAGHASKVFAMAFAPGILAGTMLALRGKYWSGGALLAFFLCLELGANHIQITYYLFMALAIYVGVEAFGLIKAGKTRQLTVGLAAVVGAGLIAAGSYGGRLMVMSQYTKETIRGRSDLTAKTTTANPQPAGQTKAPVADGLDEDYAFQYSYGIGETLTLLIPNAYGGSSGGGYDTGSELYKAMGSRGVDAASAKQFVEQAEPGYWGEQPFVGGPIYAGAVLLFLFVLGMIVSTNRIKWFVLGATALLVMIAWGKHFMLLNGALFELLPYFNKFRAMTMAFGLVQLLFAIGAALGLHEIVSRNLTLAQVQRPLLISLGATAGLALLMALAGSAFFAFRSPNDAQILGQYFGEATDEMVRALVSDRESALRSDALRSALFILLAAGAVWALVTKKIKPAVFYPVLLVLLMADLSLVDRRYLNGKDFVSKSVTASQFEATPADLQILQDKTLSYRVLDNTGNFMSDNRPSYFHKSVGGYHAAKLRRYQELIEYAFPKNSLNVLNMLNAKYIILPGQQPQSPQQQPSGPVVQQNPDALGNAWFVKTIQVVPDADAEIAAVQKLNPRDTAVVDKRFAEQLKGLPAILNPTGASIRLTKYEGDRLTYESNAPTEQVAVFSEIYYRGDTDWQFFVDGKPTPHFRANYVLRAMRVPAGSHKIECRFEPPVVATGNLIDLISNILLIGLVGFALFRAVRSPGEPVVAVTEHTPAPEPVVPVSTPKPGKKQKS